VLLSSVGPINSKEHLQKVLAGQWTGWTKYGTELYDCLAAQEIPAMVPLPPKTKGRKHATAEMASGVEVESTSKCRRPDRLRIEKDETIGMMAESARGEIIFGETAHAIVAGIQPTHY
jgi:hypothetical protein